MNNLYKRILKYSLAYLIIAIFIVLLFYLNNKSFVWVNVSYDGMDQHLVNLGLLKNFLLGNHQYFFWNVGYGMDLFANFAYYIFGDFPSIIGILFKDSNLDIAYEIVILLRIYLSGLAFIVYANDKKYQDKSVIIGSVLYAFSTFTLFDMARHPYFLNSMILFPILLLSVEKLVLKDKKIFFIIMVTILFLSSFYFGYMLSIIVMIYGIILACINYPDKKIIVNKVFKAILLAIIGIMIAGVILIPTFEAFINSPRTSGGLYFYPLDYYPRLLASLISTNDTGNWSLVGISSIILVTLPMFIKDKNKNKSLYYFLIILFIPLIIPIVGTIVDCMSFPNNRWIYVIPFILSLITIEVLESNVKINYRYSIIVILIYLLTITVLRWKLTIQEIVAIALSFVFLWELKNNKKYLLPTVIISLICNVFFMYDTNFGNYFHEFVSRDAITLSKTNNGKTPYLDEAIDYIKEYDSGFYNILVYPPGLNNLGIINNYNSSSYFYSIVSRNYFNLAKELENSELTMNKEIKSFNYRTKINELLNNKYLVTTSKDYHPYGYEVIKSFNDETYVLENKLSSSFLHLYTKTISEEDYNNLSPLLKEDSLLKYQITDKTDELNLASINSIPYQISETLENNKIIIDSGLKEIYLNFSSVTKSELYLSISNLQYQNDGTISSLGKLDFKVDVCMNDICFSEWEDNKYFTPYYIKNDTILINLGYYNDLSGEVKLVFNNNGTYSFDKIELLAVDFSDYEEVVNNSNVPITNVISKDNSVSFDANIKDSGTIAFTTNYSKYFTIYVDGKIMPSKIVNKYFLGCDITEGMHHIEIIYHNTLIKKSFYVSILGVMAFSVIIVIDRRKKVNSDEKN